MMQCPVIIYFNCENGILVLDNKRFTNKDEYDNALYMYNHIITNLIKLCNETYLFDRTQTYLLDINEKDREFLIKLLNNIKISDSYSDGVFVSVYNIVDNCIRDRNEELAFKILHDVFSDKRKIAGIPFNIYGIINKLLLGEDEETQYMHFINKSRIDSKQEEYIKLKMDIYPNELDCLFNTKENKKIK